MCVNLRLTLQPTSVWSSSKLLTRGLEPPRVAPYGPEPYASANSATRASEGNYHAQSACWRNVKTHRHRCLNLPLNLSPLNLKQAKKKSERKSRCRSCVAS